MCGCYAGGSTRSFLDLYLQDLSTLHRGTQAGTAVEQGRVVPSRGIRFSQLDEKRQRDHAEYQRHLWYTLWFLTALDIPYKFLHMHRDIQRFF